MAGSSGPQCYGTPEKMNKYKGKYNVKPALESVFTKDLREKPLFCESMLSPCQGFPAQHSVTNLRKTSSVKKSARKAPSREPTCHQRPSSSCDIIRAVYSLRNPLCCPSKPPSLFESESDTTSEVSTQRQIGRRRVKSAHVAYRFNKPVQIPDFVRGSEPLTHKDLTNGQKQYIWGVAKLYSMTDLREAKKQQMQNVLDHEFMKRVISKGLSTDTRLQLWKEYCDYQKMIDATGKRHPLRPSSSPCWRHSKTHSHSGVQRPYSRASSVASSFKSTKSSQCSSRKSIEEARQASIDYSDMFEPDHGTEDENSIHDSDIDSCRFHKEQSTQSRSSGCTELITAQRNSSPYGINESTFQHSPRPNSAASNKSGEPSANRRALPGDRPISSDGSSSGSSVSERRSSAEESSFDKFYASHTDSDSIKESGHLLKPASKMSDRSASSSMEVPGNHSSQSSDDTHEDKSTGRSVTRLALRESSSADSQLSDTDGKNHQKSTKSYGTSSRASAKPQSEGSKKHSSRPKSAKFKSRDSHQLDTDEDISLEESLAFDVEERLSLSDPSETYI